MERELALARPELDLDRTKRQAERNHLAPDLLEDGLHLIEAVLGQILVALSDQADLRRLPRPSGIGRIKAGIVDLENMKLDFEPGHVVEAGIGELLQRTAIEMAGRERHRLAVA